MAQIITATQNTFDTLTSWNEICHSMECGYLPEVRLCGGLDHIEYGKNQIKVHDIGVSNGSNIRDNSYIIRRCGKEKIVR